MNEMGDAELKELASSLPDVVLKGKAPCTAKQYSGAFAQWKRWADSKPDVCAFTASPFQFSHYLNFPYQKSKFTCTCGASCLCSVLGGFTSRQGGSYTHDIVKQTLTGAFQPKQPITADILSSLVDRFGGEEASLSDIRTLAICLISFAGLLHDIDFADIF